LTRPPARATLRAVETLRPKSVRVALACIAALYAAVCLRGIANGFYWGHDGYNAAGFAIAARNTLRHGVVGMALSTDPAPPAPTDRYVTHPLLIHYHHVAAMGAFGDSPLALRATAAAYSLGTLLLLFAVVRRLAGPGQALVAAAAFALAPLNAVFANVLIHDHGCIFWTLLFAYLAVRWLAEGGGPRGAGSPGAGSRGGGRLAATAVAMMLALSLDWPAYFSAFAVFCFALATAARRPDARRRAIALAGIAVACVAASAALHLWYVLSAFGDVASLKSMYGVRTAHHAEGYLAYVARWAWDMYGPVPIALGGAWLASLPFRVRRGTATGADAIAAVFLFAQVANSALFRQGGFIHRFWLAHGTVALAIASGVVLWEAAVRLREAARDRRAGTAAAVALIALAAVPQVVFAARIAAWGARTGALAVGKPEERFRDWFDEIEWLKDLRRTYHRDNATFLAHPSVGEVRREIEYHLDAPVRTVEQAPARAPPDASGRHAVMLFDLYDGSARDLVRGLAARHPVVVHDRRFVAVDMSASGEGFAARARADGEAGCAWRWLVNWWRPPVSWVEDPFAEGIRAWVMVGAGEAGSGTGTGRAIGGRGGTAFSWRCPPGLALAAIDVKTRDGRDGSMVDAVRPVCAPHGENPAGVRAVLGPWYGEPWHDGYPGAHARLSCPGESLAGVHGTAGRYVASLGVACPDRTLGPAHGRADGAPDLATCPADARAVGIHGRYGALVDAVGADCAPLAGGARTIR